MFVALSRFTRLPAPQWLMLDAGGPERLWLQQSVRYFPLVGLAIGAVASLVYVAAIRWFPPAVCVLFTMATSLVLTGAMHERGFAAVCEAWGGNSVTSERDAPAAGHYGSTAIAMALLLKFALLSYLTDAWIIIALLCGHAMSRFAALTLPLVLPMTPPLDVSRTVARTESSLRISAGEYVCAAAYGILPLVLVLGNHRLAGLMRGPMLLGAGLAFGAIALFGMALKRRSGAITDSGLGAAQQLAELMFYAGLVVSPR